MSNWRQRTIIANARQINYASVALAGFSGPDAAHGHAEQLAALLGNPEVSDQRRREHAPVGFNSPRNPLPICEAWRLDNRFRPCRLTSWRPPEAMHELAFCGKLDGAETERGDLDMRLPSYLPSLLG